MVAMSDDGGRSAELAAMAKMTEALIGLTSEISSYREAMTRMEIDIAIMKERQTSYAELKERLEKVERRDTEQDGAVKLVHFLKDYLPWFATLATLAWGFLWRTPPAPPQ